MNVDILKLGFLATNCSVVYDENGDHVLDDAGNYVFNAVPTTDWSTPETLEALRQAWAEMCNAAFEANELDCRIDHRSFERQGVEQVPTIHEGPNVRKMESKGVQTEKGKLNRWIRNVNRSFRNLLSRISALMEAITELKAEIDAEKQKFDAENIATLLNIYYQRRNAGAYSSKAKADNLQEQIDTFNYLQSKGINTLDDLKETVSEMNDRVFANQATIRKRQDRIRELTELIGHAETYQRLKPVYDEMNKIHWKKKQEQFRQEHQADLQLFYLSRRKLDEQQQGDKSVPLPDWRKEQAELIEENKTDYAALKAEREEFAKLKKIEGKLESALRDDPQHYRAPER